MSREAPADADIISDEELTALLAEAEGRTPEEIERGAAEIEIAPPRGSDCRRRRRVVLLF
ncbi:hypothetical protein [Halorubrum sp. ASP1]|uniref:hypothetical protein n=1 Tax=Halorubrum sp. ASP1 TaxID=2518114 RepID=UPI001F546E1F|nr:hypothetical protein [Halorubrum sp. ASP1]